VRWIAAALLATAIAGCRPGSRSDLESPDPSRRAAAVLRLGGSGDPADLAPLLVAQQDPDPRVRRAAAAAFGTRGGGPSLDGLAPMLADPDPDVVAAAARALASLRPGGPKADARAAAELQQRVGVALAGAYGRADARGRAEIAAGLQVIGGSLRDAVEAEARWLWNRNARALATGTAAAPGAAEELGRSGRAEAVRLLLPIVDEGATGPVLAAATARGLGWSGDGAVVEPLEALLRSRWADVAEAAAWGIGNVGDVRGAESLAEAGSTAPGRVALAAATALEAMPPAPEVGVALCEVAVRSLDPTVAEHAAAGARSREADCPERALAQRIGRGGPEAAAALAAFGALGLRGERLKGPGDKAVSLLQSSTDARLRTAAARALGHASYPAAVPALQRRATTAAGDELGEITVALAQLAPDLSAPLVARLVVDPDPRLRSAAARSLARSVFPEARETLERLASDPELGVRTASFGSLGSLGGPGLPALAAAAAGRPAGEAGVALAGALAATGDPRAVPVLAQLLDGPEPGAAAAALGRLGKVEAVAPLLAALASGRTGGRLEIVEAIGSLGASEAGDPLAAELTSDRPALRAAAARALGRIRHESAASRLEALRSDYYVDVRRAAIEALARLPTRAPVRR
jgi:HEAT repeat protein